MLDDHRRAAQVPRHHGGPDFSPQVERGMFDHCVDIQNWLGFHKGDVDLT